MTEEIERLFENKEEAIDDIKRLQGDIIDNLKRFEMLSEMIYHKDHIKSRFYQTVDKFLSLVSELGQIKSDYEQAYVEELKKYEL